ncbi:tRNA (adenosine(37)-N6)-dimethylallyltransferase MiaA [bacterium]|nr:tRNA (adenosine(37)-N6)-dimethylallyltransferase MiaA [bacterium]
MREVLVIMGATATGKSALALDLAERAGRELISADSRQVYAGLRVGTAQPTAAERARAVHHGIDFLPLARRWSAQAFASDALALLRRADRPPAIVVGGTGFYLEALCEGLFPLAVPAARLAALRGELGGLASPALHARLMALDPVSAARLHPNDRQRLLRALEVCLATGQPLAAHHARGRERPVDLRWRRVWLALERPVLAERIAARLDAMLAGGWREEVAALLGEGADPAAPGLQTLGYPEVVAHLRGRLDRAALRAAVLLRTRQYAKRQETWFRHRGRAELVLDPRAPDTPARLAALLAPGGSP